MEGYYRDGVFIPNPKPIKVPLDWQDVGGMIATQDIFPVVIESFNRGEYPSRYLQERRLALRKEFALHMMEAIEQSKTPVVVEFEEQISLHYYGHLNDRYKLIARFTPTQTREIVFARPQDIGFRPFAIENDPSIPAKPTFRKRLKFLFTGNKDDLK